jgi:hypothetical protein
MSARNRFTASGRIKNFAVLALGLFNGAGDGTRTRDHLLGRQRLYH